MICPQTTFLYKSGLQLMGNGHNKVKELNIFSENAPTEKEHFYVQCKTQKYIGRRLEVDADTILKWKKTLLFTPVYCNKSV